MNVYIPCYTDLVLQSTIIFSCASSTLETTRIPKKNASSHHEKKQDELRGGNVTLGQLLIAAQKMASAIRVEEQNPGDFGWMSCKVLGNSPLFERNTYCFGKKIDGKGAKEE